ncbi:sensor histidine kinase [Cytobacillus sp. FJAT-54145]|uniref:histidine kinase n=1 Tax=Cytobacillus spartinae TaxID=3299023 RepID=A0ABW6K6M7_9BACI
MEDIELLHKKNKFFIKISWLCLLLAMVITWSFTGEFQYVSALILVGIPLGLILSFLIRKKIAVRLTMYLSIIFLSVLSYFLIIGDPHITSYFVVFFVLVIVRLYEDYRPVIFSCIVQSILTLYVSMEYKDSVFESFRGSFDLIFTLTYIWVITLMNLGHIRFTKGLQKEIERSQQEILEEKTKVEKLHSLAGLVTGVAHEINTPLGISLTGTSHLSEKVKDIKQLYSENQMKRKDLDTFLQQAEESTILIEKNLHRASKLIKSFKQVSVDQSFDDVRVFSIKEYLDETIMTLSANLKQSGVKVDIDCDPELKLEANPTYLFQIITNLVMNSLIHAFPVEREQTITIHVTESEEKIKLVYEDNGKGMREEVAAKIFEPFYTTNRANGGSGLGMHIVHNLVTMTLSGTILCESEPGHGTRFTMTLPAHSTH